MATKALIAKARRPQKFSTREYQRCGICGRSRGTYRKFGVCRICLRNLASRGEIPGMRKASW